MPNRFNAKEILLKSILNREKRTPVQFFLKRQPTFFVIPREAAPLSGKGEGSTQPFRPSPASVAYVSNPAATEKTNEA